MWVSAGRRVLDVLYLTVFLLHSCTGIKPHNGVGFSWPQGACCAVSARLPAAPVLGAGREREPQQMVDLQRCLREVRSPRHAHGGNDYTALPGAIQHHATL